MTKLKSGEKAPKTGTYNMVDDKGSVINTVHVNGGDTMPPTLNAKCCYEIAKK